MKNKSSLKERLGDAVQSTFTLRNALEDALALVQTFVEESPTEIDDNILEEVDRLAAILAEAYPS